MNKYKLLLLTVSLIIVLTALRTTQILIRTKIIEDNVIIKELDINVEKVKELKGNQE